MRSNILALVACVFVCITASAQTGTDFRLSGNQGHLFFETSLCGESVTIMVESGIPAFLIGQDFYERNRAVFDLTFAPSNKKMNLGGTDIHDISFTANGVVHLDGAEYDGPVFVLRDFADFRIPVQHLKSPGTDKSIVLIDVPQGRMSVLSQCPDIRCGSRYKLRFDRHNGLPLVRADISLSGNNGAQVHLKEELIIDFGNPMLLFLMKQHKSFVRLMNRNLVVLHDAYNSDGVPVAQGIYSEKTVVCGKIFGDTPIGVTDKMKNIRQFGFLGIPFFNVPVILDFERMEMIAILNEP